MFRKMKKEQTVLLISLFASVAFVLAELFMALYSGSRSVWMDAAFDGVELIITGISVLLAPLLYQPVTERRPFGFSQCESLFLIVKGLMLALVTGGLILDNIQLMLHGGNQIDTGLIAGFEWAVALGSVAILLLLRYYSRVLSSPMLAAELYGWKVDCISSGCVAAAFMLPALFRGTPLEAVTPYFDQIVAIALSLTILPQPIRMVIESLRELLLFAPPRKTVETLHSQVAAICAECGMQMDFLDMVQTGRKTWVEVTVRCAGDDVKISHLKELYRRILPLLQEQFEQVDLEILPALNG